jgi:hypothetical protein
MKDKSKRARGLLPLAVVLGTAMTAVLATACSKDTTSEAPDQVQGIGLSKVEPVASSPSASMPLDATPSPDGTSVYFIAFSSTPGPDGIAVERTPAVFKAVAGGEPQKLFEGDPLVSPFGITISDDGQTLFVADSGADTSDDRSDGKVFSMSVNGGAPTPLAGTEGLAPAGLDVMAGALYVTGRKDGQPGLFKMGLGGGIPQVVAAGAPFVDPGGVAVTRKGDAFVVDTGSPLAAQSLASVVHVRADGTTEIVKDGLAVGHPAGIALTADDSAIIVSALDSGNATDVVFRIDLASGQVRSFSDVIGGFSESAGLHRARNADVFAWADTHANQTGTVYVLSK